MTNTEASAFSRYLTTLENSRVFFEPLKGNNGDRLITMGMQTLLERHGIVPCEDASSADVILLNGGGAMNDIWPEGAAQVLQGLAAANPGTPIVVGPSSYHFSGFDFAGMLAAVGAEVTLFSREQRSMEFLDSLGLRSGVSAHLSQDLAFELEGSPFIREQLEQVEAGGVLCSMRKDREGEGGVLAKTAAPWLPKAVRKPLSRLRDRLVAGKSSGRLDEAMARIQPKVVPAEINYRDVSVSVDFDEFCRSVRGSRAVITNRLHVAILATMLSKEVHLFRGNYHKIEGVFEYSLKDRPGVFLY